MGGRRGEVGDQDARRYTQTCCRSRQATSAEAKRHTRDKRQRRSPRQFNAMRCARNESERASQREDAREGQSSKQTSEPGKDSRRKRETFRRGATEHATHERLIVSLNEGTQKRSRQAITRDTRDREEGGREGESAVRRREHNTHTHTKPRTIK